MANTEIDSLSLDIQITGLNKDDIANVDKLSRAIKRLTDSLNKADFSKLQDIKVPKGIKNIQLITQNFKESSVVESSNLQDIQNELDEISTNVQETTSAIEDDSLVIQEASEKVRTSFVGVRRETSKLQKEINGTSGKAKKELNYFEKLLKRFKTIAFIKAVRGIINAVVQAIQEGTKNLAMFDSEFNKTMSNIKTATTNIKDSLSLVFRPIVETLEPFIVSLSNVFATLGNEISKLQASMKGLSTYTKINAKYMEDYANASKKASLFNFDTFNTLDLQDESDKYETVEIEDSDVDKVEGLANLIQQTQRLLSNLIKLIGNIFKEVSKIIGYLAPALAEIENIINMIIEVVNPFISDLFESINPLLKAILVDLLPPLLRVVSTILSPILKILGEVLKVVTDVVGLVVDILAPIISSFEPAINSILLILEPIMTILGYLVDSILGVAIGIIRGIIESLQPLINALNVVVQLFEYINQLLTDFLNADFESFGQHFVELGKKLATGLLKLLASIVDSVVNAMIDTINLIFVPLNKMSEWFGWGWEVGIPHINLASLVPNFENGGFVGELWQMNEYGNPEMLYNANNSGNTAVINQAQLSLAFEQAIYNTGLLDAIAKAGIINIDGRAIAQSTTFKNEINRTNPGLNIR